LPKRIRNVAYWIKFYKMRIEVWRVYTSDKTGCAALEVVCYADDMSTHSFYF
jgi:hypothetical protein